LAKFEDEKMHLYESMVIAREEWLRCTELRSNVRLFENEFIIMPNYVHGILWLTPGRGTARRAPTVDEIPEYEKFGNPVSGSIPTIVRACKSAVSKRIHLLRPISKMPVWQRNYYSPSRNGRSGAQKPRISSQSTANIMRLWTT